MVGDPTQKSTVLMRCGRMWEMREAMKIVYLKKHEKNAVASKKILPHRNNLNILRFPVKKGYL